MNRDKFIVLRTKLRHARDRLEGNNSTETVPLDYEELVSLLRWIPDAAKSLNMEDL